MGSEFVVTLPVAIEAMADEPCPAARDAAASSGAAGLVSHAADATATARQPVDEAAQGERRRVMVVDDSVDGAESMSILLEMLGHEVRVMYDGAAAIAAAGDFKPEVVLLDIGLPGIDGYQVARALRAEPATAGALLIALTGYGQESDRQRTRDAGFDHHLVKPASLDDIERVIAAGGVPHNPGIAAQPDVTE